MESRAEKWYELMRKESHRLKTFQMNPPWPLDYIDIKKLAKAGFFYTFKGDEVLCAFCRGQLCKWKQEDDPMSEHARNFITCPFIMGGEVGNEPLGEDPFPGPKRPRAYDVCGIYQPNYPPEISPNNNNSYDNDSSSSSDQEQRYQNETVNQDSQTSVVDATCKVCYRNPIELVFLPCAHSVSCLSCAERLHDCPYCRATITTRIRHFLV